MNNETNFFESSLKDVDIDVYEALKSEWERQQHHIELIASENIASRAVLDAVGSVANNKYAEGYPGRRYYGGCEHIDVIESLAIERVCKLFDCEFANVQPHSGSQANQAVFMSLMQPGDCFLGLSLAEGGHLTHGAKPNVSGKWFRPIHYGVDATTHLIDYDKVLELAREHQPKVIIAGASAYPRVIDFKRMREIADDVGAFLMVDMAHIAGLVATGCHPSPLPHAHVVTSTTHKTLRGARGGLILTNDAAIIKKVNSAIFPGLQGGPLEQQVAGKAVAFKEAMSPSFRQYGKQIVANARAMADSLKAGGIDMVSGGTDTHLILIDLRKQELTGTAVEVALESLGIVCNKNGVPNDPQKPTVTSGIRIGTPAITSRGFTEKEATETADILVDTIKQLAQGGSEAVANSAEQQRQRVRRLTDAFPIYSRMPSS